MKKIRVALAGNPNAGKTTIFNALTGARQHVGNYPGVTVEKKEGKILFKEYEIIFIDLPGTYSLTAYSPDEVIARKVLLEEDIDLVVDIADASNAERSLSLTAQLKELNIPMVLVLNMIDAAESRGVSFDTGLLSQLLGMTVIPMVGIRGNGMGELLQSIIQTVEEGSGLSNRVLRYEPEIEKHIREIEKALAEQSVFDLEKLLPVRWLAVKLLENDADVIIRMKKQPGAQAILRLVSQARDRLLRLYRQDPEFLIVSSRYAFVRGACREAQIVSPVGGLSLTEKIDRILLNRVLGIPIFLGIMWLLFQLTFSLGKLPGEWIDSSISLLGSSLESVMEEGLLRSLTVDGIIGGVGGVLVFLPNIVLLYLGITFLEATGYMARAAFVVDRLMHKMGLHGKSFIPMMLGFGCSIPAVMATRTMENPRDRLATMLVIPFMSCGARLPVYTLLAGAFFTPAKAGSIVFSIYLTGVLLAVLTAKVLRAWVLTGPSEPFVMELPDYRMPLFKNILIQVWERAWLYVKKAGTVILAASVLLWALFAFPLSQGDSSNSDSGRHLEESYAGQIGHVMEPLLTPIGFDWKTGVALLAGFTAKEVIVSTMSTMYSITEHNVSSSDEDNSSEFYRRVREKSGLNSLTAYVLMLFILLYVPCISTLVVVGRETNGWTWPLFLTGYTLLLAWTVGFLVYRAGLFLRIG